MSRINEIYLSTKITCIVQIQVGQHVYRWHKYAVRTSNELECNYTSPEFTNSHCALIQRSVLERKISNQSFIKYLESSGTGRIILGEKNKLVKSYFCSSLLEEAAQGRTQLPSLTQYTLARLIVVAQ